MREALIPTEFTYRQLLRLRYLAAQDALHEPSADKLNLARKIEVYCQSAGPISLPAVEVRCSA